jgi:hypothetical protein
LLLAKFVGRVDVSALEPDSRAAAAINQMTERLRARRSSLCAFWVQTTGVVQMKHDGSAFDTLSLLGWRRRWKMASALAA